MDLYATHHHITSRTCAFIRCLICAASCCCLCCCWRFSAGDGPWGDAMPPHLALLAGAAKAGSLASWSLSRACSCAMQSLVRSSLGWCAKKQMERLHSMPKLQSEVRYLQGRRNVAFVRRPWGRLPVWGRWHLSGKKANVRTNLAGWSQYSNTE